MYGDQSKRMQVSDVCPVNSQVCTELRAEGFVWTQKKLSEEDPSVIFNRVLPSLLRKPEASAWLYILKCSIFSTQYKNVHYFRRWLEKYALEKWCD